MTTPICMAVNAFDATEDHIFYFDVNGGDQVVKNKIIIKDNSTNVVVYENIAEIFTFRQNVPANTLENGVYYNVSFITYNVNGDESATSNIIPFYCYTTPTLTFNNIPSSGIIESNSFNFNLTYDQEEGELLDILKFTLFNSNDNILLESDYYTSTLVPSVFEHTFNGFENSYIYKVQAVGQTINGTVIETDKIQFTTVFEYPSVFSIVGLNNYCEKGCVEVKSNIVITSGKVKEKYTPPKYIDSEYLDIREKANELVWDEGFDIPNNFILSLWMKDGLLGKFCTIGDEHDGYTISLVREIPYGQTSPKDVLELHGYVNDVEMVRVRSNYVDLINNQSYYFIRLKKVNDIYTLTIEILEDGTDILEWGYSNVEYGRLTDLVWGEEEYEQGVSFTEVTNNMDDVFPITSVTINCGIYDQIDFTRNVTKEYSTEFPTWDYDTRLNCDFNNNVMGGNINTIFNTIKYLRIKRRQHGTFNWVTVKDFKIDTPEDLSIVFEDYFVPHGINADYAIVPIMENGIEGDYIINNIDTKFNVFTVADSNRAFSFECATDNFQRNVVIGTFNLPNSKYPILQKNNDLNYDSGTLSGRILGYNYPSTHKPNNVDISRQTQDICDFLNDFGAKIIKDWNGNIRLVRFNGGVSINRVNDLGVSFSANWIEQGKYDNQLDLYNNNLSNSKV